MLITKGVLLFIGFWSQSAWSLAQSQPARDPLGDAIAWINTAGRDQGQPSPSYCNATFIKARILITAAHCLVHAEVLRSPYVTIEMGRYGSPSPGGFAFYGYYKDLKARFIFSDAVQKKIKAQGLRTQLTADEDIALIELQEELNLPYALPDIRLISAEHEAGVRSSPASYWPQVVSINPIETLSHMNTRQFVRYPQLSVQSQHYQSSHLYLQAGDSGAPLFLKIGEHWYLAGVAKGQRQQLFSRSDVMTRVAVIRHWLRDSSD